LIGEIEDRFHNLKTQLGDQLNVLKEMVLSLEGKLIDQELEDKRHRRRVLSILASQKKSGSRVVDDSEDYIPAYTPSVSHRAQEIISDSEDFASTYTQSPQTDSYYSGNDGDFESASVTDIKSGLVGPRSDEIQKYNSTIHVENNRRVFSYYWVVTGMSYKLNHWSQHRVLRSNSFYISPNGHRLYLKMVPRFSRSVMYIHVGLTTGEWDWRLEWPFKYKMRVAVLRQEESIGNSERSPSAGRQDLRSRLWDPTELCSGSNWKQPQSGDNQECVGLGFPHEVIKSAHSNYIWNDRIIVKLTVFLDY